MTAPAPPPPPPPFGELGFPSAPVVDGEVPGAPAGHPLLAQRRGATARSGTGGGGAVGGGGGAIDCPICGKSFSNPQLLRLHSRVHSGERPYKCFCGRTFAHRSSMTAHERTHTGENHKRTHNGTKRYKCEICQKFFSRSTTLRDHMRLHRPLENPYKCGFCNKYFTTKRSLNGHLEVHNMNKKHKGRFACICLRGGSFDTIDGLLAHMQSASCTASSYRCTVCGIVFPELSDFLEHTRVAHTSAPQKTPRWYAPAPAPVAMHSHSFSTPLPPNVAPDGLSPLSAAVAAVALATGGDVGGGASAMPLPPIPMAPAAAPAIVNPPEPEIVAGGGSASHLLANSTGSSDPSVQPPPVPDPPPPSQSSSAALAFPGPGAIPPSPRDETLQAALANVPSGTSPKSVFFSDGSVPFPGYVPPISSGAHPPLGFPLSNSASSLGSTSDFFPLPIHFSPQQSAQMPFSLPVPPASATAPPPPPPPPLFMDTTSSSSSSLVKTEIFAPLLPTPTAAYSIPPTFSLPKIPTVSETGGTMATAPVSTTSSLPSASNVHLLSSPPRSSAASATTGGGSHSSSGLPLPMPLLSTSSAATTSSSTEGPVVLVGVTNSSS